MLQQNQQASNIRMHPQKDMPYNRNHSQSPQHHDRTQQRSRQKHSGSKVEYYMGPDLHLTKHYYFSTKQQNSIGYPLAVWNLCILFCKRPALCLIVCDSESEIYKILQFKKINRKVAILADHDRQPVKKLVERERIEILLLTSKKASALCAIEETCACFSLLINTDHHRDTEHYRKLHEFLQKTGGTMITFISERRDIEKIERVIGINCVETDAKVTAEDMNREIIGDIQFVPTPKPETYSILKGLPFSSEQMCARMFEILQSNLTDNKPSLFLSLPGYITYQITTQVQFNSYKYIWNFLKDLPEEITKNVRSMTKFKSGKGAVFNVPAQLRYEMDHFIRKLNKHHRDTRFDISVVHQLPEIEDKDSALYKEVEEKRNIAMRNKRDLQVFVAGLPGHAQQPQIRTFFLAHNVNPLTIRLMRDKEGQSKGICFILCEDREHVARALTLDDYKFQDRRIRVNMAEKRDNRWDH